MPIIIPIALGVLALSAMGYGTKKGFDGLNDIEEAKRRGEAAQARYDRQQSMLETDRRSVNQSADVFGTFKLKVARDTVGDTVKLLEELKRRGRLTSFRHLAGVEFASDAFVAEMRELSGTASSILAGVLLGAVKGGLTGAALYGLAGSVGVASTGTLIAGLAGAAAKSATLAWLGGGAIAVGGFGMLGGMVVLGGIAAAPVFLITGFQIASKGEEALTQVARFEHDAAVAVSKMEDMRAILRLMETRIVELTDLIGRLRALAEAQNAAIWAMVDRYDDRNREHSAHLAQLLLLTKALSELIKAPVIVGDNGAVNPELPGLIARYKELTP